MDVDFCDDGGGSFGGRVGVIGFVVKMRVRGVGVRGEGF